MDVVQIIEATTAPNRRDPEPRDNEGENFSSYLDSPAEKQDVPPPRKENAQHSDEVTETTAPQDAGESQATPQSENAPAETTATENATTEQKTSGTETTLASSVPQTQVAAAPAAMPVAAPTVAVPPPSPAALVAPPATGPISKQPPVAGPTMPSSDSGTAMPQPTGQTAQINPMADTKTKSDATPEATTQAVIKVAAEMAPAVKPTTVKSEQASEKSAAPTTATQMAESVTKAAPNDAIEKIQADAAGKISEKDILSAKVAELLQDSRGKITVTSQANKPTFQSTLASTTNIVSAATAEAGSAANGVITPTGLPGVENPGGQLMPAAAANGQGITTDVTGNMVPGAQAAVQDVEAAAANTASQASNAARAMGQLPAAEQVSMQISTAVKDGMDKIKINLHPSELGRVEVKLELGQDGRVIAIISADKQETLDTLRQDSRSLEKALQEAGFETGSGSLNFGLSKEGGEEPLDLAQNGLPHMEDSEQVPDTALAATATATSGADGSLDIQV